MVDLELGREPIQGRPVVRVENSLLEPEPGGQEVN